MDRLKALSIFKSVAEQGSFVAVANALDISTPVVTRSVQDLETLLGVRLLHRTTRRVSVTSVGQDVLDRVDALLQSYEELASIGRSSASDATGTVKLAAPAWFGRRHLGGVMADFHAQYPNVSLELILSDGPSERSIEDADVAVCEEDDLRPSMVARRLVQVEMGLYASSAYLGRRGTPGVPTDLADHDCLTSSHKPFASVWTFEEPNERSKQAVPVRGPFHASQLEVLADAAKRGAGIVQLPVHAARECEAAGRLQRILPNWLPTPLSLHITHAGRRNQPVAVRKVIDHLVQAFADESWREAAPVLRLVKTPARDRQQGDSKLLRQERINKMDVAELAA